jgi:hypothetical protein
LSRDKQERKDKKVPSDILRVRRMVSEDVKKILALIIVTLSFLSLPVLLFVFVVVLYFDVTYAVQFYHTRSIMDALALAGLTILSAGVFLLLRTLIRWMRRK